MDNAETLVELDKVKGDLKRQLHKEHHSDLDSLIDTEMAKVRSNMSLNK